MANIYCGSTRWTAVAAWAANTAYSVGALRRQLVTVTAGNERVFRCTTAGTSGPNEPNWTLTAGSTTNDGGAVWTEVTGQAAHNGDGGGSPWAAPHARLATALTYAAAGDTVFVSHNHAATLTGSATLSLSGTTASPERVICVDDSQVPSTNFTAWATTATETVTGTWTVQGSGTSTGAAYWYGVQLHSGSNAAGGGIVLGGNKTELTLDSAKLTLTAISGNPRVHVGVTPAGTAVTNTVRLKNCTVKFANAAQGIALRGGRFEIEGLTVDAIGTAPTSLLQTGASTAATVTVDASDLSHVTAALVDVSGAGMLQDTTITDSKLAPAVAITTGTVNNRGTRLRLHNSDSAATAYRFYSASYDGAVTSDTGTTRNAGFAVGTQGVSASMTSNANTYRESPLIYEWAVPRDVTGSATMTVEIASAAALTNAEFWVEAEYPSDANSPRGATATSAPANILTAGSSYLASSETWTGSPASRQSVAVTVPVARAGIVIVRACLAKPSTTVYVDMLPVWT